MTPTTKYVDEKAAAQYLSVSVALLRKWRGQRCGPPWVKLGLRCVRYPTDGLDEYARARRVEVAE